MISKQVLLKAKMILDCLKLLLVWYLLSSEICLGCVKRTTKRALNYRLQVAKDKVGSDRYRLENYNTLHLVEVDSTKNQICNSTSFEMFAQKVQPQWYVYLLSIYVSFISITI